MLKKYFYFVFIVKLNAEVNVTDTNYLLILPR